MDRRAACWERGKEFEDEKTPDLCEQENWLFKRPTLEQDRKDKIDWLVMFNYPSWSPVQVKSPGRREGVMTLELRDKHGNPGWLKASPKILFQWLDERRCLALKISGMMSVLASRGKLIESNRPRIGYASRFPLETWYQREDNQDVLIDVRFTYWAGCRIGKIYQLRD